LRCDEEQGAVCKQVRERRKLHDQAGCGLERSYSRMSILAFKRAFLNVAFFEDMKIYTNIANSVLIKLNRICTFESD
jgi:hypothetical protein